jgi:predicted ester cyclase
MNAPSLVVVPSSGVRLVAARGRSRADHRPLAELHRQATQVRAQLSLFLAPPATAPEMVPVAYTADAELPDSFAADLRAGGPRLRAAFPRLTRSLERLHRSGDLLTARIVCRAPHDGCFFGIFRPTGRTVRFDEQHTLTLDGDRVVRHRVEVDFGSIARQLARR